MEIKFTQEAYLSIGNLKADSSKKMNQAPFVSVLKFRDLIAKATLCFFGIFLLFAGAAYGQSATATWTLTSSTTPAVTGNITGSAASFGSGVTTQVTNDATYGINGLGWSASSANPVPASNTTYFQFSVAPSSGNTLVINSLTLSSNNNESTPNDLVAISGSTSSSFATSFPVDIASSTPSGIVTTTSKGYFFANSGQTLYFRVYFYFANSGVKFGARSLALNGFTTTGTNIITASGPWTAPAGVTSVTMEAIGAGGGGGASNTNAGNPRAGGGGGGGAYARTTSISVTPGTPYTLTVGTGGTAGNGGAGSAGNNTTATFGGTTVTAAGGAGGGRGTNGAAGAGGTTASSTGTVKFAGGAGAAGVNGTGGGAGGGAAGSTSAGGAASSITSGAGGSNNGGDGANGSSATGNAGITGTQYGGGGSGGYSVGGGTEVNGGAGSPGLILLYLNPTTQASAITFGTTTINSMTINWTNGNGGRRAVFVKQGSGTITNPTNGTQYTASTTFGSGTQLGTSGYYCVFDGTGSTVNVTGLSAATTYFVQVFEYNSDNIPTDYTRVYNVATATNNPSSQATTTPCLSFSPTSPSICAGGPGVAVTVSGGTAYTWSPSTGLSSTTGATVTANPTATTTYTVTPTGTCTVAATITVTVNAVPPAITVSPSTATICTGAIQTITASATTATFAELANALPSTFTLSSSAATATLNNTYYDEGTGSVLFKMTSSSSAVQYSMNSNIDLTGTNSASLTFSHICASEATYDFGYVEYSVDGGTTYTTFPTSSYTGTGTLKNGVVSFDAGSYADWSTTFTAATSTPGTGPASSLWKDETITIPSAALTSTQFRIRFRSTTDVSVLYYGWLIDNIKISKIQLPVWSPTTGLYTNSGATTAYASTALATVYAKPTTTTTYTATSTIGTCSSTGTVVITVTPTVTINAFSPTTSTRCQGAGIVTTTTTANNSTGITYSLDATTLAFSGNSINASTGAVTYAAGWSGTTTITASAAGCNGPATTTHVVTTTPTVTINAFSPTTSTRCQGSGSVTRTTTANNSTGITYSLDATTLAFTGNSINASTGAVTYAAGWSGTTTITASAAGCNGPATTTHVVTTTPTVTINAFSPNTSTRCQGSGSVTRTTTANNSTGITYSLDATTLAFTGNSINASTGAVTYAAGWSGTTTITASAAGCNGPATTTHVVTITPTVTINAFSPTTSTRCQGAGTVTTTTTANNSTGITYSLDATTLAFTGNSINASTGAVTYAAGWSGTTTITASAAGCNGPATTTHVVTTTPTVTINAFSPNTSTRCQGSGSVTRTTTANNSTGITYSLDATTLAFTGNSINASTGAVTYAAGWSGTTTITASAAGCNGPATTTHVVTINASTIITTGPTPASQTVFINNAATNLTLAATGVSVTYQWYSNTSNSNSGGTSLGAANGAQTNTYTPQTTVAGTVYYYAIVSGTCGTATSSVASVNVTNTNTWTGTTSNNWSTGSNWSAGVVPTSTNDASIPVVTTYPVLSASSAINNLTIASGATVGIAGNIFTINGSISGTGTLTGSNTSGLVLGGTTGTVRFTQTGTGNYLNNLTLNTGATATLGNQLNIVAFDGSTEGVLTASGTAVLTTGGFLTIKSNTNGTARIGIGSTAGGYISGNVTVERFIPQNSSKSWRLLASNTNGSQSINAAWQEGAVGPLSNPNPGFGTMIPGPGASVAAVQAQGYDSLSYGGSIFKYNPSTDNLDYVSNMLTTTLSSEPGYFIFIRGDRGPNQFNTGVGSTPTPPTSSTVLRSTGALFTGDQAAVSTGASKYALLRNPYPSRLDMRNIVRAGSLIDAYQVWDPKLAGAFGVGAYQTFTKNIGTGNYEVSPGGGNYGTNGSVYNFIESGAAFFIQATTSGSAQVVEASKATGSALVNRPADATNRLLFSVYANNPGSTDLVDGGYVDFDPSFSNDVDINDVRKSSNFGENFGLINAATSLVVERRALLTVNDTIHFDMNSLRRISYKLQITPSAISALNLNAILEDKYLGTATSVSLLSSTDYTFTVDATAGSYAADRFRIIFKPQAPLPVTITNIRAYAQSANVAVEWKVENQLNINHYEIEKSTNGTDFNKVGTQLATGVGRSSVTYNWLDINNISGTNYYRIKIVDASGESRYSAIAIVTFGNVKPSVKVIPNPVEAGNLNIVLTQQPKGTYQVRLINNIGQMVYNNLFIHAGSNATQSFILPSQIVRGSYQLELIAPDYSRIVQKVIIN